MPAQQHKILRQVLEARCPPAAAERVRSELRDTYYRQLLPTIERICSSLSAPGRVHRIDRLEIDLGELPLGGPAPGLAGRFEAAFSRGLAAAIEKAPPADAELELFSYFAQTGTVPWWAGRSDRALLAANLESLIRRAPRALRQAVQAAPDAERMRRRLALSYPDALLDELTGVLAPALPAACPAPGTAWLALLESAGGARGHAAHTLRAFWWEELLRAASAGGAASSGGATAPAAPEFFRAVLTRVARRLGIGYGALLADLRGAFEKDAAGVRPWVREVAQALWSELDGNAAGTASRPASAPVAAPSEAARAHLMLLIGRLAPRLQAQALAALESARGSAALSRSAMSAIAALAGAAIDRGEVPPGLGAELLAALREPAAREPEARAQEARAPLDLSFSDADEVYVENAGLVILWPFLASFFGRLGLVEDKAFKDAAARQRAVGLLHYIATGEAETAEPLLPLNKLLCGMPLEEVFDFGAPMTDAETEACDDLLGAAIHQAPILRDMSLAGFRASFLLRKGQLGARGGNWLLRVEGETHDVVLGRFPWSFDIVRLPWMQAVMQVEWPR